MTLLLILILTVMVIIGNFADFVLGRKRNLALKALLVRPYMVINVSHWSTIIKYSGGCVADYLTYWFGKNILSGRYWINVGIVSLFFTVVFYFILFYIALEGVRFEEFLLETVHYGIDNIILIFVGNVLFEGISWNIIRLTFEKMEKSTAGHLLGLMGLSAIMCYILFCLAAWVSNFTFGIGANTEIGQVELVVRMAISSFNDISVLYNPLGHPLSKLENGSLLVPVSIVSLPILLPYLLFLVVGIFCIIVTLAQPILRKPLSVLLERVEESEKGFFTQLSCVVAAIVTVVAALQKLAYL